jgi:enoyl-CoA hydratase/carnithine racemase
MTGPAPETGRALARPPTQTPSRCKGAAVPTLDRQNDVFVLDLGDGENRFHPDWIASVNAALDNVEKAHGPCALVTCATGKFFSNGLDLEWLLAHGEQYQEYVVSVHELFARVLSLPLITVAALQGHTFAAGAMLSLAHDFRVMRADRGYWCLPEADINIPFTPGMSALIQARLTPQAAHEAMTTARRYAGPDAAAAAIVDRAVDEDAVRRSAVEIAEAQVGKAGDTLGTIKARMYASVLDTLRDKDNPLG